MSAARPIIHWSSDDDAQVYAAARSRWPKIDTYGERAAPVTDAAAPSCREFSDAAGVLARQFMSFARCDGVYGVKSADVVAYLNRTCLQPVSHGAVLLALRALGVPMRPLDGSLTWIVAMTATDAKGAPVAADRPHRRIPPKVRALVLTRAGHRCQWCGAREDEGAALEVDHIIPVSAGGSDRLSNLQALCWACNRKKGADTAPPGRRRPNAKAPAPDVSPVLFDLTAERARRAHRDDS